MLRNLLVPVILVTVFAGAALAVPSDCEECHAKITPNLVADFNRGVMAQEMDCTGCHGDSHKGNDDVDKALLPTIETCAECHEDQATQYLDGKHAGSAQQPIGTVTIQHRVTVPRPSTLMFG